MDFVMIAGSFALAAAPVVFATMVVIEIRRVRQFLRDGVKVEGEIIGEELHGIRSQAPYPVVQFRASDGSVRQFRSLISRRTRHFIHPERVTVRYFPDSPEKAELFSGFHPYKHLATVLVVLFMSIAFAFLGLPMFFEQ
jgi:hypothetical protein